MPLDSIDSQLTVLAVLENMMNGNGDDVITLTADLESDDIIDGLFMLLTTLSDSIKEEHELSQTEVFNLLRNRVLQPAKV